VILCVDGWQLAPDNRRPRATGEEEGQMLTMLAQNWWLLAIRGIAAIAFGILSVLWPGLTLAVLIALFAAYALVDGASLLISLIRGDPIARRNSWSVAIIGILGIAAAVIAILYPNITALTLLYVVAFWSIAIGVLQLVAAIRLRQEIEGELWLAIGGIISIVFGIYLVVFPGQGLLSLIYLVAIWSIAFGITSLILAFRLRGLADRIGTRATSAA
jgi:uncharacterized membrane protein HdeD (DUF308 family)